MKTKSWIIVLAAITIICLGLSAWLLQPDTRATQVRVISEGKVLYTLPLTQDTQVQIATARGINTVTVKDGKVAVTEADCPDQHCKARGYCSGGIQIICLPNRLVLEFVGQRNVDGVSG